jgi:hypothetical protein
VNSRKGAPDEPPSGILLTLQRNWLSRLPNVSVIFETEGSASLLPTRITWGLVGLFAISYAVMFSWFSPLALQDLPNHLARARIMGDLLFHHGTQFGEQFDLHFLAIPYLLGDIALATTTTVFGTTTAAMCWTILSFLSLPAALMFYLRNTRLSPDAKALFVLLSLYLATDWFFLTGFLEFRLGVAVTLVILALAERFRTRPTAARMGLYGVVVLAGYLIHLTTLVFASALLGSIGLWRLLHKQTRLPVEAALLAPCATLLLWHFGFTAEYRRTDDLVENPYIWGTLPLKLAGVIGEFRRYSWRPDQLMLATLVAAVGCQAGYFWRRELRPSRACLESLVLAAIMLAVYFILPMGYAEAYYVDVRALPFVSIFLILSLLSLAPVESASAASSPAVALLLAAALIGGNFVYLAAHMRSQDQGLKQYRSVMAFAPPHSRILPIYTQGAEGKVVPRLHTFAFASIDRDAVIPYLQTADTGNPQKYLRYRHRPYAPEQMWYSNLPPSPVDWQRVACEYQYLLVIKPFNPSRLGLTTTLRMENDSASLLAIQKPTTCAAALESATARAD